MACWLLRCTLTSRTCTTFPTTMSHCMLEGIYTYRQYEIAQLNALSSGSLNCFLDFFLSLFLLSLRVLKYPFHPGTLHIQVRAYWLLLHSHTPAQIPRSLCTNLPMVFTGLKHMLRAQIASKVHGEMCNSLYAVSTNLQRIACDCVDAF